MTSTSDYAQTLREHLDEVNTDAIIDGTRQAKALAEQAHKGEIGGLVLGIAMPMAQKLMKYSASKSKLLQRLQGGKKTKKSDGDEEGEEGEAEPTGTEENPIQMEEIDPDMLEVDDGPRVGEATTREYTGDMEDEPEFEDGDALMQDTGARLGGGRFEGEIEPADAADAADAGDSGDVTGILDEVGDVLGEAGGMTEGPAGALESEGGGGLGELEGGLGELEGGLSEGEGLLGGLGEAGAEAGTAASLEEAGLGLDAVGLPEVGLVVSAAGIGVSLYEGLKNVFSSDDDSQPPPTASAVTYAPGAISSLA